MAKQFLYFLIDQQGQSLMINGDGKMVTSSMPVPIKHAPDGWQSQMVQFKKSTKYQGLLKSFTLPLRFVKDGAKILRSKLYTEGFESVVYLIILKLNPETVIHESWFKGEIDFSKVVDEQDFFEVNVREGGVTKLLTANEAKTYEYPLDESSEFLLIDGPQLQQSTTSQVIGFPASSMLGSHLPQITIVASEGNQVGTHVSDTEYHQIIDDTDNNAIVGTNDPVYTEDNGTTLKLKFDYRFKTAYDQRVDGKNQDPSLRVKVDIRVFNSGALKSASTIYTSTADIGLILGPPTPFTRLVTHEIKVDVQLPLDPGDEVFFYHYGTPFHDPSIIFGGSLNIRYFYVDVNDITLVPGTVNFAFDITYPETPALALTAETLFGKLMNSVSEGTTPGQAPVLKVTGSGTELDPARSLLIVSGDSIRQIDGAVIKTSFNDFYMAMDVINVVGMDIRDESPLMDSRDRFYEGDVVYDFGDVKRCEIVLAEDRVYNSLKVGYPDQEYEDVNGRSEFNTIQEYGLPVTRIVKSNEIVSPYRTDCYGIEFTRINMEGKSTTDSNSDNDVFVIDAYGIKDETGRMIWRPYRRTYADISGVLTTTIYNLELSPKRILLKHGPWIHSFLHGLDSKEVKFQSCEKNAELSTLRITIGGDIVIAEKANVPVKDLGPRKFLPFYADITVNVPLNYLELIPLSRAGRFAFSYKGQRVIGILEDGGIKPATREEQNFRLLLAPENDLKKLIR